MTIKENRPLRADGIVNLDDRNYITLGLTYDEYLDLRSLIEDVLRTSIPLEDNEYSRCKGFLLCTRDVRLAKNLFKRLNSIY